MLTNSYNGIMAPLVMRSWDDRTACWACYVVAMSSMTPPASYFLLPRPRLPTQTGNVESRPAKYGLVMMMKSDEGLFSLLFLCFRSVCPPRTIGHSRTVNQVWTQQCGEVKYRDSGLYTTSCAFCLCDAYSLFRGWAENAVEEKYVSIKQWASPQGGDSRIPGCTILTLLLVSGMFNIAYWSVILPHWHQSPLQINRFCIFFLFLHLMWNLGED